MSNPERSSAYSFDPAASQKLKSLAASSNTTEAALIRRALALYDLVVRDVEMGEAVTITKPNGQTIEIVIPGAPPRRGGSYVEDPSGLVTLVDRTKDAGPQGPKG